MWKSVVCAMLTAMGCSSALGETVARPAAIRTRAQDWTLIPIGVETNGQTSVKGVLAIRDSSTVVGDNIGAIWYESPAVYGGAWESKAWTGDPLQSVKYVKSRFEIEDIWDPMFGVGTIPSGTSSEPKSYSNGLMIDDPFFSITLSAQRDLAVSFLTGIGYKAADVPIEKVSQQASCGKNEVLTALSDAVIYSSTAKEGVEAGWASQPFAAVLATCAQVAPPPPPPPPPCGPWGCLPGTLIPAPGPPLDLPWGPNPPRWQPGVEQDPAFDPSCSTPTTVCYKQEVWYWYYDTCFLGVQCVKVCKATTSWTCPLPPGGAPFMPPLCTVPTPIPADPTRPVTCGHWPDGFHPWW
ncbi:MAG: hypothetical protein K2W85_14710 [Phycisphaerales bacterium]|nr:hypothetical protein [Phycisphaerales bacterium]